MPLHIIDQMWERARVSRSDSDMAYFLHLLYLGELLTKVTTSVLVASLLEERERHRYRHCHRLVRASSLGDWASVIDDVLTGPSHPHLRQGSREHCKQLTTKCKLGSWEHESVRLLEACVAHVTKAPQATPATIQLRRWFSGFVQLRNASRGHGALGPDVCSALCPLLETSIGLLTQHLLILQCQWAYLYRNLSGKYRVTQLTPDDSQFSYLRSTRTVTLLNGVYVFLGEPVHLELIVSNQDASDFWFPNGNFDGKRFELISYHTNDRREGNANAYIAPATPLPPSETEGLGDLDVIGHVYSNLPPQQHGYISRLTLEKELYDALVDDRHPIITLSGRGGIGKTWLALAVLHNIAHTHRFTAILWLSARDIDLLPEGPKLVRPHILRPEDVAVKIVDLLGLSANDSRLDKPLEQLGQLLRDSTSCLDGPLLIVLDNFETVVGPVDFYSMLDTYIRLPNKILITTRVREFRGDYPVEVQGMTEPETDKLIDATAAHLDISSLLTPQYREQLHHESDGHPYVVKILLGEVAKARQLVKIDRIIASQDEILAALFERTYTNLTPAAKRVFLTLCSWRSAIPELALEAVLLRPTNDKMPVENAIEELLRSSFIEKSETSEGNTVFLSVPLVAWIFGKRKLEVSPIKAAVEADSEILQLFGATQEVNYRQGVDPKLKRMFSRIAELVSRTPESFSTYLPILEFVSKRYSPGWLLLSRFYQETPAFSDGPIRAKDAVRRFLEQASSEEDKRLAWTDLERLCKLTSDWQGELQAVFERSRLPNTPFRELSAAANKLNNLLRDHSGQWDSDEKRHMVGKMIELMSTGLKEANADDYSRLAWLALHMNDEERAMEFINSGLKLDVHNPHCLKLAERLKPWGS